MELRLARHPDPEVDRIWGYIGSTVEALEARGVTVHDSWLDPRGPIDATLLTDAAALVWDEWRGWVRGDYLSGSQGERTVLAGAAGLGGGVLAEPAEVAFRFVSGGTGLLALQRVPDARDGLFDRIDAYQR